MKNNLFLILIALALLVAAAGCQTLASPAAPAGAVGGTDGDWPADATADGVLERLDYSSETCDGIPQYYYTASDGTEYAFNFDESWVWREGREEAAVDDETARFLRENAGALRCEPGTTLAAQVGYTGSDRLMKGALNAGFEVEAPVRKLPLFRLDTKRDADRFLTDYGDILQFDYRLNGGEFPSLREILDSYGEDFYAKKSLMLVYLTAGSSSNRYGISEVTVTDVHHVESRLCRLLVDRIDRNEVGTADMAGWILLTEMADEDLDACDVFNAEYVLEE